MKIDIGKLAESVMADIEDIAAKEKKDKESVIDILAEEACQDIQANSPTGGRYKSGWKIRRETQYGIRYVVVYNAKEPELTAIFEDGTGQRTTTSGLNRGRIKKHPHIRPAFYRALERHKKDLGG